MTSDHKEEVRSAEPPAAGAGSSLRALARQRDLASYQDFRREFDRVARRLDRNASGHVPSQHTFQEWMAGRVALPRDRFSRQVLEAMFPGRTAEQMFGAAAERPQQPQRPGNPRELGALLRQLRSRAQVSQAELARECTLDRALVTKAESGQRMLPRRFWAEADIALAAEGVLVDAYDRWAEPQNTPRSGVRVLARRHAATPTNSRSAEPAWTGRSAAQRDAVLAWVDHTAPLKERDIHSSTGELTRPVTNLADRRLSR